MAGHGTSASVSSDVKALYKFSVIYYYYLLQSSVCTVLGENILGGVSSFLGGLGVPVIHIYPCDLWYACRCPVFPFSSNQVKNFMGLCHAMELALVTAVATLFDSV